MPEESYYKQLQLMLCEAKHVYPDHDCTKMILRVRATAA